MTEVQPTVEQFEQPEQDSREVAVCYSRVSTGRQAASGLGLAAQTARTEGLAAAYSYRPVHFQDAAVSGTIKPAARQGLAAGLAMLKAGTATALIVAEASRISRKAVDILLLAEDSQKYGFRLIVADLSLDTGTAIGKAMLSLLATLSQLERDLISERTTAALAVRKQQGQKLGRPVLLPDSVRQQIGQYRQQGLSLRAIAAKLQEAGIPTATGKGSWQHQTVASVLQSLKVEAAREAVLAGQPS